MKKISILFVLVALTLISCNHSKKETAFVAPENSIVLSGNPTTGYSWEYSLDEAIVEVKEEITYLGAEDVVGAPSRFVYTFTAIEEGSTEIHFAYRRSWETEAPLESKNYKITVDKALNIQIKEL